MFEREGGRDRWRWRGREMKVKGDGGRKDGRRETDIEGASVPRLYSYSSTNNI